MRRTAGPRLEAYALVAAAGLVASLALRRPELAALSAPFVLLLVVGLRALPSPQVRARLSLAAERVVEGEDLDAELVVESDRQVERLELLLELPAEVDVVDGSSAAALRLEPGETHTVPLTLRFRRWGLYDLGHLNLRAVDSVRVVSHEQRLDRSRRVKVYPRSEQLRRILAPRETQVFTGSEVSRTKADGIEYADLRPYVHGDRLRSINWRASARRDELVVNERHPERNTDVVLFVDAFADIRRGERGTLDDAVRAAAALAARYLERRDRVGLVSYGGVLRWLQPGMGEAHRYRLVETVLETGVRPTYTWRNVSVIPARILPPKALVVGITPLADERFVATLVDLRARRYDVAAVEVDPVRFVEPGRAASDRLAYRLWLLEREAQRIRLNRLGIAVARWNDEVELEAALEGVRTYRRRARHVYA